MSQPTESAGARKPVPARVVGIGASAGGLDAMKNLLAATPVDTGMAFVAVFHLDPGHASRLAEILQHVTTLPVSEVEGDVAVEADHVYVIAPQTSLRIEGGVLRPGPRAARGLPDAIDKLLCSLAEDQGDRAAAVILSGAGEDGAAGVRRVAAAGGLCIAQDPSTAEYDSMPNGAIRTGAVHRVLPPAAIPAALAAPGRAASAESTGFDGILALLGRHHGVDFGAYKKGTLLRRSERRLALAQAHGWDEYLAYLNEHPEEVEALYQDLLIGVTRFFRDPEVWSFLASDVVPEMVERHDRSAGLRVWVAGCATGEEVYSLAMVLLERIEALKGALPLRIFATDVDEQALASARRGIYPPSIEGDVSAERLGRFFVRHGDCYQVVRRVRELVTFAVHDVLADPPFSKLDMVSCRNLLIYLEPHVQERLLELFHFALRPGGVLLLGTAETVGRQSDLFDTVSSTSRVYRASPAGRPRHYRLPVRAAATSLATPWVRPPLDLQHAGTRVERQVQQVVLGRYTTACVVVNRALEMLYVFGPTGRYLEQPAGEVRRDLLSWVHPGLYPKVRTAFEEAVREGRTVHASVARVDGEGASRSVEVSVEPMPASGEADGLYIVAFREQAPPSAPSPPAGPEEESLVRQLEVELRVSRQELRDAVEELERMSEEYRAGNEELLSLNEELQTGNEELEASKEELQSLNEEMETINRQLADKNTELLGLAADLDNFLVSTAVPTVFLDRELRIRRFTPAATELMRLVPPDVGRSLEHVKLRFDDPQLASDARMALAGVVPRPVEVRAEEGRWYLRQVLPYRAEGEAVEGVTMTFVDVTDQKRAAATIQEAREYAESIVQTIRTPLLVVDDEQRVVSANRAFYEKFHLAGREVEGRPIYAIANGAWDLPELREVLEQILPEQQEIRDYEIEQRFGALGALTLRLDARLMRREEAPTLVLLSMEDVTERKLAEATIRERADQLLRDHHRKDEFLAMLGHELRNPLSAVIHGIELLEDAQGDPAELERIRLVMVRQTRRIQVMLNELLDIARVISGKIEIARAPVDVTQVVHAALESVTPLMESRGHRVSCDLPPAGEVYVRGDAVRLAQVFENLLGNAAKYTDSGGSITVEHEAAPDTVTFRVRDTGAGIEPELLPRVFDLFTQAQRSLARSEGGLGLGLPLVRRLVEMHGGQVRAASEGLGRGSEFTVTLPRLALSAVELLREPVVRARAAATRRVLVVDDEPDTAELLASLLRRRGHETVAVHDGPSALAAARTYRPDVVLLDLGLHGMDGYDVAERLRREGDGTEFRVIAVTGYEADEERLARAGFDGHVIKPPDIEELEALFAPSE